MNRIGCNGDNIKPNYPCSERMTSELIYMTIPVEWACIYQKLLLAVADFGEQALFDCKATCKDVNKNIVNCWNMFASAVAAYQIGNYKMAATLIKYIDAQLKVIYRNSKCKESCSMYPLLIDEDGILRALFACDSQIMFYVDINTGYLYEDYSMGEPTKDSFTIIDNKLVFN